MLFSVSKYHLGIDTSGNSSHIFFEFHTIDKCETYVIVWYIGHHGVLRSLEYMYVCMIIGMYVCMYVRMIIGIYVCMYVCMYVCTYDHWNIRMYVCMIIRIYVLMYVRDIG